MLGFIVSVLVIGAILSLIFGRAIGQIFVLGTAAVIGVCTLVIALIIISGLIYMQFQPEAVNTPTHLGDPTVNTYVPPGGGLGDAPVAASPAPVPTSPAPVAGSPAPSDHTAPPALSALEPPPIPNTAPQPNIASQPPAAPVVQRKPFDGIYNPMTGGAASDPPMIGVEMLPLIPSDEDRLGLKHGYGVYVDSVKPGGPGDLAGLKPGDVITAMDGQAVSIGYGITQYEVNRRNQPISLFVYRVADGKMWRGPLTVIPR